MFVCRIFGEPLVTFNPLTVFPKGDGLRFIDSLPLEYDDYPVTLPAARFWMLFWTFWTSSGL